MKLFSRFFLLTAVLGSIGTSPLAQAANALEPAFCNPATFSKYEVKYSGKAPERLHVYKIGQLTLAGMAVGNSNVSDVIGVAKKYSTAGTRDKYCTWYLNDGNKEASQEFDYNPLPKPTGSQYDSMSKKWMSIVGDEFDQEALSFVSCAEDFKYIGMGCDGQKHRGPTVFGMLLSYAGCSPANSVAIVNKIWGENGITPQMRKALAQKGADLALAHPQKAQIIRDLLN